jgi:transcription elongation factor Elf1
MEQIVYRNKFGICPICNHRLSLLHAKYTASKLSENGWIEQELASHYIYKAVCPKCGFVMDVHVTPRGLEPVNYIGKPTQKPILDKDKFKAGYIEKGE